MENIAQNAQDEIANFFKTLFVKELTKKIDDTPEKVKSHLVSDLDNSVQQTIGQLVLPPLEEVSSKIGEVGEDVQDLASRLKNAEKVLQILAEKSENVQLELVATREYIDILAKRSMEESRNFLNECIDSAKREMVTEAGTLRSEITRVDGNLKSVQDAMEQLLKFSEESDCRAKKRFIILVIMQILVCASVIGFYLL